MLLGWDAATDVKQRLKEKGLVQRERTPVEVMLYAVYTYLLGASLQRTSEAIEPFCPRSRQAIHTWVQRLGAYVRKRFHLVNGDLPPVLVVDETTLHIGAQYWTLWVAIDPSTRAVYHLALTRWAGLQPCRAFFDGLRDRYGSYPARVVHDRAGWYRTVLDELGIAHDEVSGGIRSYIERWIETLKDRSRSFDRYHPCRGGDCRRDHVRNWVFLVAFHYNHARRHMSRGLSPPLGGGEDGGSCGAWFLSRLGEALS